ncbi:hypothetical protein H4S00_004803 [Coemansia sp. D1744]|nr:hypothetical protein GGH97_003570 [Coemansia sp. RSA 475]KAJ2715571.1 hypothetical protein H4S00_004803 [Coemansia sp. D1744]
MPARSDPRNGSPVYLSPGDFVTSFEMNRMTDTDTQSEPTSDKAEKLQLANQKMDALHVAGHGSVDVVETTPTITLRYSSNVPADVRKQTVALKNELVGIKYESDNLSEKESKISQ